MNEKIRTLNEVQKNKERLNFFNSKTPHMQQIGLVNESGNSEIKEVLDSNQSIDNRKIAQ